MIMITQGNEYAQLTTDEVGAGVFDILTDVIAAALRLEQALKAEGRKVPYIIVVDEIRRDVPEPIYDALCLNKV